MKTRERVVLPMDADRFPLFPNSAAEKPRFDVHQASDLLHLARLCSSLKRRRFDRPSTVCSFNRHLCRT